MAKSMWTHLVILMPMILKYDIQQSHMVRMFGSSHTFGHRWQIAEACHYIPRSSLSCQRDEETISQKHANPCMKELVHHTKPHCDPADLKPQAKSEKQHGLAACRLDT